MIIKLSILFVFYFGIVTSTLEAQIHPDDIFKHLKLNYPGLEKVKKACESKDFQKAKKELLIYFQYRNNRKVLDPEKKFHFNIKEANQNVQNKFEIKRAFYDFGKKIEWTRVHVDKEWQFSLGRMNWFENYIGAYQETRNEKYVKSWMQQIESWMELKNPGYPRTIDTGRRLENWVTSHWMFVHKLTSPSVTPDFNAKMLLSMLQQAEFLYNPDHWRRYSNWGTFENAGLAQMAIMYPEFTRNDYWLKEIFFRMDVQLHNSYYPDGMHIEVSPSYHNHELEVWFNFIRLAELNEVTNPWSPQIPLPSLQESMLNKAKALMHWYKPTGYAPQVGDTDERDERDLLYDMGKYWDNQELIYVATNGVEGKVPQAASVAFPDGGYYIMRSGWGKKNLPFDQELYLLFDCGMNKPWHAHYDMLNIVATAYGYELLKDPGRFTYNDGEERDYFKSTAAHNTIVIDSQDQPAQYIPEKAEWYSLYGFDYVIGTQNSHPEVGHHRSIVFVKPEYWVVIDRLQGTGNHTYDQYWHLSDHSLDKVKFDNIIGQVTAPHLKIISLLPEAEYFPEYGWLSFNYRQRVKAPVIKFRIEGKPPETWATIIYPFREEAYEINTNHLDIESVETTKGFASRIAFSLEAKNEKDVLFEQEKEGKACKFDNFETDAKMLWIRLGHDDTIKKYHQVGGSYMKFNNKAISSLHGDNVAISVNSERVDIHGACISNLELSVIGNPGVFINTKPVKVNIKQGILKYSFD